MNKHLIFVESQDDKSFLIEYLSFLSISQHFEILTTDNDNPKAGKNKLPNALKTIGDPFQSISIIFDADDNFLESQKVILQYVKSSIENTALQSTKNLLVQFSEKNIFLFPNNSDNGTIEDLLLKITQRPDLLKCVEQYYLCLKGQNSPEQREHKLKYHSYLVAMGYPKKVSTKYAERFKFNLEALYPLKIFLENIIK